MKDMLLNKKEQLENSLKNLEKQLFNLQEQIVMHRGAIQYNDQLLQELLENKDLDDASQKSSAV